MGLRALDLFCCAGGAGMGLSKAGFEVVGVDIRPQPRYPFEFHQADALTFPTAGFDFIWASPPCQAHTSMKTMHNAKQHLDLIPETREKLKHSGLPYIIENVVGAPLIEPYMLCGTMFGLGVDDADLQRHRIFETSFPILMLPECNHARPRTIGIYGKGARDSRHRLDRTIPEFNAHQGRAAMGIDWMTLKELSQAIPPAYSEFLAREAIAHIESRRVAA